MSRAKLKGAAILVGVFLLGAFAGSVGTRAWLQRQYTEELLAGPGERVARRHFAALSRELDLTGEQRDRIERIMREHRTDRDRIMQEVADDCAEPMMQHKDKVDAEIRAVLTPEQQVRFDALLEKQRERFPFGGPSRRGKGARRGARGPQGEAPAALPSERGGMLRRFDADGDGKLVEAEVPPDVWSRISSADTDGDGAVTRDELRAERRGTREQRPPPPAPSAP